ncbi:respiratory nitrate reductase subunit gamma [Acidiferrobacter sp.]|uniref:respiratory nitrate reductase subunit gamma n=1 Tax=Acidiferrobacter sp. TaxID=1872107 RepID=UPI00261554F5|nr:respiratory nitrate reductase subunit gamma [Acidiferrobacter sp.]
MSAWTIAYAVLLYVAFAVLVGGIVYKIGIYAMTPAPLRIPTMPAPRTRSGVVGRMAREVGLFASLFRGDKWAWIWSYLFHVSLLLVLVQHLRYVLQPVPQWLVLESPFGSYAAFVLLISLAGLLGRRLVIARVRFVSAPSDYLMLILLLVIAATGAVMRFADRANIVGFKAFIQGVMALRLMPLPQDPVILVHVASVALLMLIFPFSKLLHAPGVFFSPTRNQVDNSRLEAQGAGSEAGSVGREAPARPGAAVGEGTP